MSSFQLVFRIDLLKERLSLASFFAYLHELLNDKIYAVIGVENAIIWTPARSILSEKLLVRSYSLHDFRGKNARHFRRWLQGKKNEYALKWKK